MSIRFTATASTALGADERWVRLSHGRVRYLHAGSGPPLLLIHGLLGYSFSWRYNLQAFARHASVFAPDLPGCGMSDACPGPAASICGVAKALLEFMDALGIPCCDVVATSHGGPVAMMAAAHANGRGTSRIRRMVLSAPVNPWSSTRGLLIALLQTSAGAALFRAAAPHLTMTHEYWLQRLYGDPGRIPPGTLAGYLAPLTAPGGFDRSLGALRTWRADLQMLQSALPQIAGIPTLLIWGTRDRAVSPRSAERLSQVLPAKLVLIEGAGHLPYEECPEEFNRAVTDFLWTETHI